MIAGLEGLSLSITLRQVLVLVENGLREKGVSAHLDNRFVGIHGNIRQASSRKKPSQISDYSVIAADLVEALPRNGNITTYPLELPSGYIAAREYYKGISIRVVEYFDLEQDSKMFSFDLRYEPTT